MRLLPLLAFAAIAACSNQTKSEDAPTAPAGATEATGHLEPRVNLAQVDPAKAKAVMHERHEGMETIGDEFKKLRRNFGGATDMKAAQASAATIDRLAQQASGWFPAGTGPAVGKTGAKDVIWQKPQDFTAKLIAFQKSATAFDAAAKSGNADTAKAAYGDLGKTCKACHDTYRSEMH